MGTLHIDKSLFPIKRVSKEVNAISKRLEPLNAIEKQRGFDVLCNQNLVMRAVWYAVGITITNNKDILA